MTNGIESVLGDGRAYDAGFLGTEVSLPRLGDEALAARLDDGTTELNYLHFTAVQREP
ncbi:hypothetical protein AB0F44_06460 [Nocardioides sp. NPDC023903]|uniref:hypothetical protein n=1 Tax=Nocardioides sp. NPDC023903 TaxID=3157195 RepID=UPI0033C24872